MPHHEASPYTVSVTITRREDLERQLDLASGKAIREAQVSSNRGILVTRHDHGSFTVELSAEVPYGTTIERDLRAHQGWSSAAG